MPINYWITILATAFSVVFCVVLHYEGLRLLSDKLPMPKHHHIVPMGPVRFITGTEALSGLTFITWSASFTFLEMLKTWNHSDDSGRIVPKQS